MDGRVGNQVFLSQLLANTAIRRYRVLGTRPSQEGKDRLRSRLDDHGVSLRQDRCQELGRGSLVGTGESPRCGRGLA